MPEVTIKQLADDIRVPVAKLLEQLGEIGLENRSENDSISAGEKTELLGYLRRKRGKNGELDNRKITLKRKTTSQIKVAVSSPGPRSKQRTKTVNVETRKRRTYVKRKAITEEAARKAQAQARAAAEEAARQDARENQEAQATAQAATAPAATAPKATAAADQERETRVADQEPTTAPAEQAEPNAAATTVAEPPVAEPGAASAAAKAPADAADEKKAPRGRRAELHVASDKSGRRKKKRGLRQAPKKQPQHVFEKPTAPIVREVEIPENITVSELAQRMSVKSAEVIKTMMALGTMATINQVLDQETAALVTEEMGHKPKVLRENALEEAIMRPDDQEEAVTRPPVVTIMGHVDHGKTSLLDFIRNSRVAAAEAGGVTQHIGAYSVRSEKGVITFLDTPGHEAFTAMRARGAGVTDIVVLVVAADDGVMPQTEEAIQHARAGSAALIVAINKIDKEEADAERVKQELAKLEVVPEEWGGDALFVNVSAKTGEGVDALLESISLQAEILELKAPGSGPAAGTVIESRRDRGKGPVAAILVQGGRLNQGDIILAGQEHGRVRALYDENGNRVQQAGPSTPVEVQGLSDTPLAGDSVVTVPDERTAREIALSRQGKRRDRTLADQQQATRDKDAVSLMGGADSAAVNVLIKADVQGSAEALAAALRKLSSEEVAVNVVSTGVGGITESDINLALASKGRIVGFNVRVNSAAKKLLDREKGAVDVQYYSVIYEVIDDVKAAMAGLLTPETREQIIGVAEVREVFHSPKFGDIAGCLVSSGTVRRANPIRVLRDDVVIYEGELESLRRFKDDVAEVKAGVECGIGVKNYSDVEPGDQIEVFERVEASRGA